MTRRLVLLLALAALVLPGVADAKDGGGDIRAAGVCSTGVTSQLRLKADGGAIGLRFGVGRARAGAWRVVLVQERRVVWRGQLRTNGSSRSFELRHTLRDLDGADTVTATAWGPQGLTCRASATLPASTGDDGGDGGDGGGRS